MHDEHFDTLTRVLSRGISRRTVLGAVAGGAALHLAETEAKRRKRTRGKSETTSRGKVTQAASSVVTIQEGCPENPPQSLAVLHAYYPGYWWDHTDLTVAVQAPPIVKPALLEAVHEAITVWNDVLQRAFGGLITLTDVTSRKQPAHKADIVVHYVPHAGGAVFAGMAICGNHKCNNVMVSSDAPKPLQIDQYTPEFLGWVTLHELGHALGLGHAEPLEQTNDLMGYGWPVPVDHPVLSPCDLRTLEVVFAWAFEGVDPYPPAVASVSCSGLCGVP